MKLAEKLAAISDSQQTNEEAVSREIINFFAEKFENGEMMEAFEKSLGEQEIHSRKKSFSLDFWTYIPGCSETYFGLLGKEWKPEKGYRYEHKGINLKNIYENVLLKIAELARESFEKEGFKVRVFLNDKNKRYKTYIIEVSW